ncbi:MAG: glycerophosphodiester phosphodiesterase family protein [Verrucomicrobiales bacterium]|nr:glycerophosphodiester phosphodiesterase family protein [Verrucomicrobiales bacterium]
MRLLESTGTPAANRRLPDTPLQHPGHNEPRRRTPVRRCGESETLRWQRVGLTGLLALTLLATSGEAADLPALRHSFVVIAHRGDHTVVPENTLAAIERAAAAGADFVEIDARQTRDGHFVLMHDGSVERTTDGKGAVRDLTLAEVKALTVRDARHLKPPLQGVPTFQEALDAMHGRINLYLDFKEGSRELAVKLLRQHDMLQHTVVYDDPGAFAEWRRLAPELPLMCSLPDGTRTPAALQAFVRQHHPDVLDGSVPDYTKDLVAAARGEHVPVWADIQGPWESPPIWQSAVDLGLQGLQTDNPKALVEWLNGAGRR